MQKLSEEKFQKQQMIHRDNIKQCENDYKKQIEILKEQKNEQLQNELKQQKDLIETNFVQVKTDLENHFQDKVNLTKFKISFPFY
jgi:F0F1-type ATP synthase membrane subunit b/b'